jgi:aspartate racemase
MKTIGVLGGLGPQATMDFEARIHRISQEKISPQGNSGYPPMIVHYCRYPPILIDEDNRPVLPYQPEPRLLQAARDLGALADFLVITANGPHAMLADIEAAAGCKILSMIEVTLDALGKHGWRKVGLLGLGEPRVYIDPVEKMDLTPLTLQGDLFEQLNRAIMTVMEGRDGDEETHIAQQAVNQLRHQGAEGVILGCTEIPLLLKTSLPAKDLLNPGALLAESAVEYAISS